MRFVLATALAGLCFAGAACFGALPASALGYHCNADSDCFGQGIICGPASVCVGRGGSPDGGMVGFPTATNTGVPPGTTLTPTSGPLTLNGDGGVYDSLDISGCVIINGNGITLRRSHIACDDNYVVEVNGRDTTLEDDEIDGEGNPDSNGVSGDHLTATRLHIHDANQSFNVGDGTTIQDCYLHDYYKGINSNGGQHMLFKHNRMVTTGIGEMGILVDNTFGVVDDVTLEENGFSGGNFGFTAGGTSASTGVIKDNVFFGGFENGPYQLGDGDFTVQGNVWADGGAVSP